MYWCIPSHSINYHIFKFIVDSFEYVVINQMTRLHVSHKIYSKNNIITIMVIHIAGQNYSPMGNSSPNKINLQQNNYVNINGPWHKTLETLGTETLKKLFIPLKRGCTRYLTVARYVTMDEWINSFNSDYSIAKLRRNFLSTKPRTKQ
ncbi:hypothetical protein Bhyg_04387 [Pseudolycoriella hygida]|uniref:Uncharacterized protein n=1 Tax=Pseudolycoriella hygida TaxID=35572 RepID=A0A9Q0NF44_9DIPT|nr:hypothetical protein Bhyg_04387 [Pseudolycoriella hygida]